MDSRGPPVDRLSNLPDALLVLILSCLSLKDCVKTSVLSTRWRYLCLQTKNVSFKESEYVNPSITEERSRFFRKLDFVNYMCRWVSRINDQVIDTFEICLSNPQRLTHLIEALIALAVTKKVKKLVLDFSNPAWDNFRLISKSDVLVELPESVYKLTTLESLKVFACKKFDPKRFANPKILRSLSFGWMKLPNVEFLLSKSTKLESLSISNCWGLDFENVAAENIREFVFESCDYPYLDCYFDLPKVNIFKYSGDIFCLNFDRMNKIIKEVFLDFEICGEEELSSLEKVMRGKLCGVLNGLRAARTLRVCMFFIQVLQEYDNPTYLLRPMETQHLVLQTMLHPTEFNGIRLFLNNCPHLETLTLDMLPRFSDETASSHAGIDPETYWLQDITYECSRKTLKVVVFKNFAGSRNELNVLKYLIRSGPEHESALRRVELYVSSELGKRQKRIAHLTVEMLQQTSKHITFVVHR